MTTATRHRTGADIFATVKPIATISRRKCAVCDALTRCGDVCELCREKLPALLAQLHAQQDTIIKRMAAATVDLELHISCASSAEQARYVKMCELRKAGKLQDKDYRAAQALQDGLGAIVRADSKVYGSQHDSELLTTLERKVGAVELAITGLKEST